MAWMLNSHVNTAWQEPSRPARSRKIWNDWRKSRNPSIRILQKTQRLTIGLWLLWQQGWTVRFHKAHEISWWSERLSACAGLFSMNLVRHSRKQNKEYGRYTGGGEAELLLFLKPAVDCRAPPRKERSNPRKCVGPTAGRDLLSPPPQKKPCTVCITKEAYVSTVARLRPTANGKCAASYGPWDRPSGPTAIAMWLRSETNVQLVPTCHFKHPLLIL
jgi:hypothetical protein